MSNPYGPLPEPVEPEFTRHAEAWTQWGWPQKRPVGVRHGWTGWPTSTCCGRTPGELPAADRMVTDLERVTCPLAQPAAPAGVTR